MDFLSVAENQEVSVWDLLGYLGLLWAFCFGFQNTHSFHRAGWFAYRGEFTKAAWLQVRIIFTCMALSIYT